MGRAERIVAARAETLVEIGRACAAIATRANAASFSLFTIAVRGSEHRAVPLVDDAYPGITDTTRLLATRFDAQFARRMCASPIPCRFAGTAVSPRSALEALYWTDEIDAPDPTLAGVALPLMALRGEAGALVLTGNALVTDMLLLSDIHGEAIEVFADAARIMARTAPESCPPMSSREVECLRLTADGHTSETIAQMLGLSVHTANQYLASAGRKLNAVNRMHAVAKALRTGLID